MIAAFAVFAIPNNVQAQDSFGTVGLDIAVPLGDFGDATTLGLGPALGYDLAVSDQLSLHASSGLLFYLLDDEVSDFFDYYLQVPLQVGGRFFLDEVGQGIYVGLKVGGHITATKTADIELFGTTTEGETNSDFDLSLAPELGLFVTDQISASLRYQMIFIAEDAEAGQESDTFSYIGLTGAFHF
ncbi:outer membrane beta-barrel protein [Halocola ammonii]